MAGFSFLLRVILIELNEALEEIGIDRVVEIKYTIQKSKSD